MNYSTVHVLIERDFFTESALFVEGDVYCRKKRFKLNKRLGPLQRICDGYIIRNFCYLNMF